MSDPTPPRWSRRRHLALWTSLALAGVASGVRATTPPPRAQADDESAFWAAAREGGVIFVMRHALTDPGIGDPPGFRLEVCSTQRNLSAEGRTAAAALGRRFREASVRLDAVYSSAWCRCTDTARLAFDPHYPAHTVWPDLNSFFQGQGDAQRQTQAVLQRVQAVRAPSNWMLVTHQVNITALTGAFTQMGEVLATVPDPGQPGRLRVLGRLRS